MAEEKIPQAFSLGWKFDVIEFYPYTSCVLDRIIEKECHKEDEKFFYQLMDTLIYIFNENSTTKIHRDNKIAFKVISEEGNIFYIGFRDLKISIGFKIEHEGKITRTVP